MDKTYTKEYTTTVEDFMSKYFPEHTGDFIHVESIMGEYPIIRSWKSFIDRKSTSRVYTFLSDDDREWKSNIISFHAKLNVIDEGLKEVFDLINEMVFDSKLPDPYFLVYDSKKITRRYGGFVPGGKKFSGILITEQTIVESHRGSRIQLYRTMCHEMCHYLQYLEVGTTSDKFSSFKNMLDKYVPLAERLVTTIDAPNPISDNGLPELVF